MEVILIFYQSGGVINRYRIFSIYSHPLPISSPGLLPLLLFSRGKALETRLILPPPPPARPGIYYKRCLVSLNLQSARARFLLRRVDSFFLAGVNLALVLMTMIT